MCRRAFSAREKLRTESTILPIYNSLAKYFQFFQRPLKIERRLLRCSNHAGKNELLSHDIFGPGKSRLGPGFISREEARQSTTILFVHPI